ncbi:hypothetical protein Sa4125_16580 [Aureimonas sp. SA4125]|nr:hypothetical protein Sa4125_16580 [Aureimonas sp. SA4125]
MQADVAARRSRDDEGRALGRDGKTHRQDFTGIGLRRRGSKGATGLAGKGTVRRRLVLSRSVAGSVIAAGRTDDLRAGQGGRAESDAAEKQLHQSHDGDEGCENAPRAPIGHDESELFHPCQMAGILALVTYV